MSKWTCENCDVHTDDFDTVWSHCKGASHVMFLTSSISHHEM